MHYAIADFIVDIAQNSCEAGAANVLIRIGESSRRFEVRVEDDGRGMDEALAARVLDPFYTDGVKHPARRVGLGLPFLRQAVELNGGSFSLCSRPGQGTEVAFRFDREQIDCPPAGDIPEAIFSILCYPGSREIRVYRAGVTDSGEMFEYELSRRDMEDALGNLEDGSSLVLLRQYLRSQELQ